ncbi:MAG: GreA/GreB family elongation factor [Candidatus Parcubacteria bacterium]|nr:GreA/GreB family elongation factor [Candidatus Parcubacteria bacterium]
MVNYQEKFYLTSKGLEKLKKEYEQLLETRNLQEEDSESLVLINQRFEELSTILKTYELIQAPPKHKQHIVNLGATVAVEIDGQTDEFIIVGTLEANPSLGRISNESPVGRALLNHKVKEEIIISSNIKTIYKIKEIRYEL